MSKYLLLLLLTVGLLSSGIKAEHGPTNPSDLKIILTEKWRAKFEPSLKLDDYALAVDEALGKTSIAENSEIITALSDLMSDGNKNIFFDGNFVSVKEYVESPWSDPQKIVNELKKVKVNKLKLFDYLTRPLVSKQDAASRGLKALENIFIHESSKLESAAEVRNTRIESGVTNDKKVFVLPEFGAYFAAKYLVDHVEGTTLIETTKIVLENEHYVDVAEFLDSAMMESPQKFRPILEAIREDANVMERVLDNALSYGFDEVASAVIATVDDPAVVRKYLQVDVSSRTKIPFKPRSRFGVMATSDPVYDLQTREEMLFKGKMEKTVRTICDLQKTHNIPAEKFTSYVWDVKKLPEYLEKFVVTDPMPSTEIYNTIMERLPNKLSEPLLNKMVVEAITHGGRESTTIVKDLKSRGATPETIVSPQGETLVHIAVKKCDSDLLRFVVEDLKVPIPKGDPSLLITLLDANSQPRYSKPGFWQTTQALIELSENEKIAVPQASDLGKVPKNVKPTAEDMKSAAYKLLTGDKDPAVLERALAEVKVSSSAVEKLSLPVRNFRRNMILSRGSRQDKTTLTEILLKYRGLDTLSPVEQSAYEASVRAAFAQDAKNSLTQKQVERIGKALGENVGPTTTDSKIAMDFLLSQEVTNSLKAKDVDALSNAYEKQRKIQSKSASRPVKYSLKAGVSQTRAEAPSNVISEKSNEVLESANHKINEIKIRNIENVRNFITESQLERIISTTKTGSTAIDTKNFMDILYKVTELNSAGGEAMIEWAKNLVESGAELTGSSQNFFEKFTGISMPDNNDHPDVINICLEMI